MVVLFYFSELHTVYILPIASTRYKRAPAETSFSIDTRKLSLIRQLKIEWYLMY